MLPGLGVDQSLRASGVVSETTSVSSVIARIAQVAIILFFAIAATRMLGFPELTAILDEILELGGRVIFGAVVIGFGFLIANLIARIIGGDGEQGTAATIVRYATIVLFTFMGLTFMGVGDEIVQLAFGALVIGAGVAGALAFGLGGREWAGRKLEELDTAAKEGKLSGRAPATPSMPRGTTGGATATRPATTTTATTASGKPIVPGENTDDLGGPAPKK